MTFGWQVNLTCTHEYQHQVNPEQETQDYLDEVVLRLPGTNPSIYGRTKD